MIKLKNKFKKNKTNNKKKKGITLISLSVMIIIISILTVTLTLSIKSTMQLDNYYSIKKDLIELNEDSQNYYLTNNGQLPIIDGETSFEFNIDNKLKNPNDNDNYYNLDYSKFLTTTINNKNVHYIINEKSLTVYCQEGYIIDGILRYTIVDGTTFYQKTDLPIISVVTFESNNAKDKYIAYPGDVVTLKMIKNYQLTSEPTVTINGQTVTLTWNGNIGYATYKVPDSAEGINELINFSIVGYAINETPGEEINKPTFEDGVLYKNKNIRTGLKVGDYVDYTPDKVDPYVTTIEKNGYSSETINQDTTLKWRILKINEDGSIKLLSEKPTSNIMHFGGINGYNNGNLILHELCEKLYSNSSINAKARSIKETDIEEEATTEGVNTRNSYYSYKDVKRYTGEASYYPIIYEKEIGAGINTETTNTTGIKTSDIIPLLDNSQPTHGKADTNGLTATSYFYNTSFDSLCNKDAASVIKYTSNSSNTNYWIATRYLIHSTDSVEWGLRLGYKEAPGGSWLFDSQLRSTTQWSQIRPIVEINANTVINHCTGTNSSTNMHTIKY